MHHFCSEEDELTSGRTAALLVQRGPERSPVERSTTRHFLKLARSLPKNTLKHPSLSCSFLRTHRISRHLQNAAFEIPCHFHPDTWRSERREKKTTPRTTRLRIAHAMFHNTSSTTESLSGSGYPANSRR